jgi:hypothetical protein
MQDILDLLNIKPNNPGVSTGKNWLPTTGKLLTSSPLLMEKILPRLPPVMMRAMNRRFKHRPMLLWNGANIRHPNAVRW